MENKLIIKTTITESKQVEIEVALPFYSQEDGDTFFKVYNDGRVVRVYASDKSASISDLIYTSYFEKAVGYAPCTEDKFNKAFEKALDFIKINVNLWVSVSPLPTPEEYGLDPNGNEQQRDINLITC